MLLKKIIYVVVQSEGIRRYSQDEASEFQECESIHDR